MKSFIMVTPARDEEDFLPKVIESVSKSSVKPKLWLIVDDNSRDRTPQVIEEATKRLDYVRKMELRDKSARDLVFHYAYVCIRGFDSCLTLAEERGFVWDYIVLLDADTVVEPEYFQDIIAAMEEDTKIGIASGSISVVQSGKVKPIRVFKDIPSGTARVWRKRCFLETNGYTHTQTPDTVSTVRARLRGWKTVRFQEPKAYQLRRTSSAQGLWKGFITRGKATYYLDYSLILVLARGLSYTLQPRFYLVIPYAIGYAQSFFKHDDKISDKDIRDYYRKTRIVELIRNRGVSSPTETYKAFGPKNLQDD
jgi:glycosyltransferase involved in cell wall biosynthesis